MSVKGLGGGGGAVSKVLDVCNRKGVVQKRNSANFRPHY